MILSQNSGVDENKKNLDKNIMLNSLPIKYKLKTLALSFFTEHMK